MNNKLKMARTKTTLALIMLLPFTLGGVMGFFGMLSEGTPFFANLNLYLGALAIGFVGLVGSYFAFKSYNKAREAEGVFQ